MKKGFLGIDWATLMASVFLSVFVSGVGFALHNKYVAPRVITLNIDEILGKHVRKVATSKLNDAQKQAYADRWSKALDDSIKELADGRHVVLTQKAVVDGGTNYTQTIEAMISQKLKKDAKD